MFVSVIVPCYNHAPYLKQRIESILNQTYQNFELILLDDVSPDESGEILLSYKDHPKVSHCIINEKNSGSTFHQWNKGMQLAQGELIWIAESDDIADLSFLEILVEPFQHNPNLVLAYSQSHRMDSQGKITGSWKSHTADLDPKKFDENFTMLGLDYIAQFLVVKNTIPNASAVLFKKSSYLKLNEKHLTFKLVGDWLVWSKIISQGDIYFCSTTLNFFRYHNNSTIAKAKQSNQQFTISNEVILFREHMNSHWSDLSKNVIQIETIYKKNKKYHFKAVYRNSSLAIRKRLYKSVPSTIFETMKYCPPYLKPMIFTKVLIKIIYSITIDAPLKKINDFFQKFQ